MFAQRRLLSWNKLVSVDFLVLHSGKAIQKEELCFSSGHNNKCGAVMQFFLTKKLRGMMQQYLRKSFESTTMCNDSSMVGTGCHSPWGAQ